MIEKNKNINKRTCEYNYSNYKLVGYNNGMIHIHKGPFSFIISDNLQNYGLNKLTSMFVMGEKGERELILEDDNFSIILNFELILDKFRILFGKRSRKIFESG